jgi:hypothetical protein
LDGAAARHHGGMTDALWPLTGLLRFASTPAWWLRPLCVAAALGSALLATAVAVAWWRWPGAEATGWHAWLGGAFAIGQAAAVVLACWLVLMPLILGLIMDALVHQVHRHHGVPAVILPAAWPALLASLRVTAGTVTPRLLWGVGGVVLSLCAGPIGAVLAAFGIAHIACLDALDLGLAARGLDGAARLRALHAHRQEVLVGSLVAGALNLALAATVIGWLLWLPALVTGAAKEVLGWPEVAPPRGAPPLLAAPAPGPAPAPAPPSAPG